MIEKARQRVRMLRETEPEDCIDFPYEACTMIHAAADLIESLSAQLEQVTRERDAAVNELVKLEYPIPCESDEFGGSEYCEENCRFKYPQKECWLLYLRECCAEVEG